MAVVKIARQAPGSSRGKGKPDAAARPTLEWGSRQVIEVWVPHLPAPQGSHRQGFGKSVRETNPKTEPYRQAVADACERELERWLDWEPLDVACSLHVTFWVTPPPKSEPDRKHPFVAPDIDKLLRATFDGITRGRLWKDDARCVAVTMTKRHAPTLEDTGAYIKLWEAE